MFLESVKVFVRFVFEFGFWEGSSSWDFSWFSCLRFVFGFFSVLLDFLGVGFCFFF